MEAKQYYVYLLMLQADRTVVANIRLQGYATFDEAHEDMFCSVEHLKDFADRSPNVCLIADAVEDANGGKLKKVIGVYTAAGACMCNMEA